MQQEALGALYSLSERTSQTLPIRRGKNGMKSLAPTIRLNSNKLPPDFFKTPRSERKIQRQSRLNNLPVREHQKIPINNENCSENNQFKKTSFFNFFAEKDVFSNAQIQSLRSERSRGYKSEQRKRSSVKIDGKAHVQLESPIRHQQQNLFNCTFSKKIYSDEMPQTISPEDAHCIASAGGSAQLSPMILKRRKEVNYLYEKLIRMDKHKYFNLHNQILRKIQTDTDLDSKVNEKQQKKNYGLPQLDLKRRS